MPGDIEIRKLAKDLKCCVVVPTYNNSGTLVSVIEDISDYIEDIIIVNDGSTDNTDELLRSVNSAKVISYMPNRGKGFALRKGFRFASENGFRYAVTIDSDGQHRGSDIGAFLNKLKQFPGSLIIGSRLLKQENMPGGNTFANKFSNFWFHLQTGTRLPDTQSGFRLYPLDKLSGMHFVTNRYEAELEILVRASWKGISVVDVPISVYYPPVSERITHFRPYKDFIRISILNTFLTLIALLYQYPRKLIKASGKKPVAIISR
jgi:glycosyltransferase involved in cell wall biosynthesis